jgi:hypothetical protein
MIVLDLIVISIGARLVVQGAVHIVQRVGVSE